jgi:hydroxyacylglutathione hydrolase
VIQQYADVSRNMPRVIALRVQNGYMKNYNYLVVDPGSLRAVIVDPAWEIEKIDRAVADAQATLSGVLLTHSHPDHIHLAKPLAENRDCPIWMSKVEIAASGFKDGRLVGIDTSPWAVGQMLIEPIFTPGHTPGSTCYLIGENLFTGDVLFAEGCGMCPDTEAAHAMFASLDRLKTRVGPQTLVFPGHSYGQLPGRPMSQLQRENIYLQFSDKESFAAFRLRKGQDVARMFSFRYPTPS